MPNEPTPGWRVRLDRAAGKALRYSAITVGVEADDVCECLSALDAATARAAKAEEALVAANERAQDAWDQEATANDTLTTLRARIADLEARFTLAAPLLEAAEAWSNSFAREAVFDPTTTGRQRQIARGVLLDNLKRAAEALPSHPQDPGHE